DECTKRLELPVVALRRLDVHQGRSVTRPVDRAVIVRPVETRRRMRGERVPRLVIDQRVAVVVRRRGRQRRDACNENRTRRGGGGTRPTFRHAWEPEPRRCEEQEANPTPELALEPVLGYREGEQGDEQNHREGTERPAG